jgi:hypothetical protein
MPVYDFEIGLTEVGMVNLEELDVPVFAPRSTYKQYQVEIDLGDLTVRGFGRPSATWRWGFLTLDQRDQLREFCDGKSARVYIQTKRRDDTEEYVVFYAVMVWPEEEEVTAGRVLDFELRFRDLVEVT